jgi:hypothetical protein
VFGACISAMSAYFLAHDRERVERRVRAGPTAETQRSQQILQGLASMFLCATYAAARPRSPARNLRYRGIPGLW